MWRNLWKLSRSCPGHTSASRMCVKETRARLASCRVHERSAREGFWPGESWAPCCAVQWTCVCVCLGSFVGWVEGSGRPEKEALLI